MLYCYLQLLICQPVAAADREKTAMVRIPSRLGRSQSSIPREVGELTNSEIRSSIPPGIGVEMKMIERPTEPVNDQAIGCPLPEPSILNDGTLWKERMSNASAAVRVDLPVMKERDKDKDKDKDKDGGISRRKKSLVAKEKRLMLLPSVSAPEHDFLAMLE